MKTIHVKSQCCGAKSYRFGKRRRQCSSCKKTWSIRKKKRGRKSIRVHPDISQTVIKRKESLRHKARRLNQNREKIRRRHRSNLESLLNKLPKPQAPKGQLIAVIDGWWLDINKERYTVYLVLLRPISQTRAVILDPVILKGWEKIDKWRHVLKMLDRAVLKRIKAIVTDGVTGIEVIARENNWIIQRCHFHLLARLQQLRGQKWSTIKNKELRENIYQNIRKILEVKQETEAKRLVQETQALLQSPKCPVWFKRRASGFIRKYEDFRSYRRYPKLNIPTTTNSAECVNQKITETMRLARGFCTRESFEKWIKVQIRSTKHIKCNGKIFNRNSMS